MFLYIVWSYPTFSFCYYNKSTRIYTGYGTGWTRRFCGKYIAYIFCIRFNNNLQKSLQVFHCLHISGNYTKSLFIHPAAQINSCGYNGLSLNLPIHFVASLTYVHTTVIAFTDVQSLRRIHFMKSTIKPNIWESRF